jgi:hypothetical protein
MKRSFVLSPDETWRICPVKAVWTELLAMTNCALHAPTPCRRAFLPPWRHGAVGGGALACCSPRPGCCCCCVQAAARVPPLRATLAAAGGWAAGARWHSLLHPSSVVPLPSVSLPREGLPAAPERWTNVSFVLQNLKRACQLPSRDPLEAPTESPPLAARGVRADRRGDAWAARPHAAPHM